MKKITVSQTHQMQSYEPRKIEIEIEIEHNEDWKIIARDAVKEIDRLIYPEKYEIDNLDNTPF